MEELVGQIQPIWKLIASVLEEISDNGNHLLKAIENCRSSILSEGIATEEF